MTKTQLIDRIAKKTSLTKKQAAEAFEAGMEAIVDAFASGEGVQIAGFGCFTVKEVAAHIGRNPRTNESVEIPATRRVAFAPSKTLKEKIN